LYDKLCASSFRIRWNFDGGGWPKLSQQTGEASRGQLARAVPPPGRRQRAAQPAPGTRNAQQQPSPPAAVAATAAGVAATRVFDKARFAAWAVPPHGNRAQPPRAMTRHKAVWTPEVRARRTGRGSARQRAARRRQPAALTAVCFVMACAPI
jgi:hypothetical protein